MAESALSPQLQVHIGSWINWSQGRVLGATLTMSQQSGNLLVAFVALFVAFSGTCAFRVACYVMHRVFSKPTAQDGIYHQRQAILRNSANGVTALWELTHMVWLWRLHGHQSIRRVLPCIVYIFVSVLAFAVAGVFSSNITALSGDEVLLQDNPFCGKRVVKPHTVTFKDQYNTLYPEIVQHFLAYYNYAQDCYSGGVEKTNCKTYIKSRTRNSVITHDAPCPFAEDICYKPNGSIILDTGLVDTNDDLGINGPHSKRLQVRRVSHCSPLTTSGYTSQLNSSGVLQTFYNYGGEMFNDTVMRNYTYRRVVVNTKFEDSTKEYDLNTVVARRYNGSLTNSDFAPIDALSRTDADVFLHFLSANAVTYPQVVNDPWYAAHRNNSRTLLSGYDPNTKVSTYLSDNAASPLACADQWQLCLLDLPMGKQCTSLRPSNDLAMLESYALPAASEEQIKFARRGFVATTYYTDPPIFTKSLGTSALLAKYSLNNGIQGPLQDNQWKLDMERWHNFTLAAMQGGLVDLAAGLNEGVRPFYEIARDPEEVYFCKNQKIRSTAFANFSIFGLSLIFTIGGMIIIANYVIEFSLLSHLQCLHRHRSNISYKRLEWNSNGVLQLQRLAHESAGCGTWSFCDDDTPVTRPGERLAVLDARDVKHPKLTRAATAPTFADGSLAEKNSSPSRTPGSWRTYTYSSRASSKTDMSKNSPRR